MLILDTYLWLSYHFHKYFVEIELCVELRSKISETIERTVRTASGKFKLFEQSDDFIFDDVIYADKPSADIQDETHSDNPDIGSYTFNVEKEEL